MTNEIVQYVRNRKNEKVGVVLAVKMNANNGKEFFRVGWSLCKTKAEPFNRDRAFRIARGRAYLGSVAPIPQTVQHVYENMVDRGMRYFKVERDFGLE